MSKIPSKAIDGNSENQNDIKGLNRKLEREFDIPFGGASRNGEVLARARKGNGQAKFDSRFTFTSAAALEYVLDEINLIKDLLPANGFAAFYGEPGCGKSFGTIDVAVHLAAGIPFAGKRVDQAHVVIVVAEGRRRYRNRVKAAMERLGADPDTIALDLVHAAPDLGRGPDDANRLIQAIKAQRNPAFAHLPLVIVIDTLSRTMGGAKEDDEGIGTFVSNCSRGPSSNGNHFTR